MELSSSLFPERQHCIYTACYCEENVWKLCQHVKEKHSDKEVKNCHVVFVSNSKKQIPLWHQKASTNEERLVVWDYHVILVYTAVSGGASVVYDLDTELSFPCSFLEYADACIGDEAVLKKNFWRKFRVINAVDFLAKFASDRSHMLKKDGSWLAPAPTYPPISTSESSNNLQSFISMEKSDEFGTVLSLEEFRQRFVGS